MKYRSVAHERIFLSIFFSQALLSQQYDKHPIFILKDVKFQELRAMMDYMYRGEVNISQDQLAALLKAAESLQIKGLSDNRGSSSSSAAAPTQQKQQQSETATAKTLPPPVPVNKVKKQTTPYADFTISRKLRFPLFISFFNAAFRFDDREQKAFEIGIARFGPLRIARRFY